jgi:hypothetical protein
MNVEGIIGKVESNIENIGKIVGFAYGIQKQAQAENKPFMDHAEYLVHQLMSDPHIPDLGHLITDLTGPWGNKAVKDSVMITLVGMGMEYIDIVPQMSRYGKILSKLGWNMTLGSLGYLLARYSSIAHSSGGSPSQGSNANQSNSSENLNINQGAY